MIKVFRTQLAALLRRPSRILLTGLALSVASFVILGTLLARDVTEHMVISTFSGTPEAVDLVVRSDDGLPGAALARARAVPGVAEAVGRFTLVYDVGGHQPILLAADPGTGPLSTVKVVEGRYPRSAREIAVTARTLDRLGLAVGDPLPAQLTLPEEEATDAPGSGSTEGGKGDGTGDKGDAGGKNDDGKGDGGGKPGNPEKAVERTVDLTLTVTGVVKASQDVGFNTAYTTSAVGLGLPGLETLERIEVRLSPGASPDTVRTALAAAVRPAGGAAPTFETGEDIRQRELDDNKRTVDEIFAIVGMFVAIAVLAAVLVATSTFRIVFAQRMRQLALLRAVGADRGALARALVLEGMCVGAVSGAVGAAAAVGVGKALPGILRPFDVFIPSPAVPVGPAFGIVAGATVLAVLAVLAPAFSVARVAPLEALRSSATTSSKAAVGAVRTVVGILLAGAALLPLGYVVSSIPSPGENASGAETMLLMLVLSGALAYFALVALGPLLLRPVLAVVGWPVRRLSAVGRLAAGGVGAAPRRGAAISVVVALGVTLLAGVLVGGDSLRRMDEQRLAATAPADFDIYLAEDTAGSQAENAAGTSDGSNGTQGGTRPAPLPKGMLDRIRDNPTLAHPVPYRKVWTNPAGCQIGTNATDLDLRSLSTWSQLGTFAGSLEDLGPGKAVVAADLADTCQLAVGSTLDVRRDGRGLKLTVVAVMQDTPLMAGIITGSADLDRLGAPSGPSGVLVDAAAPAGRGYRDAHSVLTGILGSAKQLTMDPLYQERVSMSEQYAMLLAIPIGLVSLTVLVALVGVGTTTALSVVERVREAGMLRAVGMSRAGLRTMLTTEAGLYGAVGSAFGLLLAVPYSWLAVRSLGADVPVSFPIGQLALLVVVLTALTALAGLAPARKAARVAPVSALAADDA